MDINEHYYILF